MKRAAKSADIWRTGLTFWTMAAQAQGVIGMRTLGMMGLWSTGKAENTRMVTEKTEAFAAAARATAQAMLHGARPDQIAMAAMAPLQRKTKSNMARLAKAGPKRPL